MQENWIDRQWEMCKRLTSENYFNDGRWEGVLIKRASRRRTVRRLETASQRQARLGVYGMVSSTNVVLELGKDGIHSGKTML